MQKWKKLGRVFIPDNENPYLQSHASNPLPFHLKDNIFRIFYSGRNHQNQSSVGSVDIDIENFEIIDYPKTPLVTFGEEGTFYSHGISIGNVYEVKNEHYILFMGWQFPKNAHWHGEIGRLKLIENESLNVEPQDCFLGLDEEDQISLSYPFVIFHEGIYKMWYGSTLTWNAGNDEMIHVIKYATSKNAIEWDKHGISIPYEVGKAQAFSKPSVIIDDEGYHMWFSYRSGDGTPYRIGYSYSKDGVNWDLRLEETGIDVSEDDWDSEMICYPYVFEHNGKRFMLYNGNGYGKTGFGLAVLDKN